MKTIALSMLVLLSMCGCNAQENKSEEKSNEKVIVRNVPKESWTVNKEVDEYGNITRYDSTYTWSYSNIEGDSVSVNVDSVMHSFRRYINRSFPSLWDEGFLYPEGEDSLFHHDFFSDGYFHKRWKKGDFFDSEALLHKMDSLHRLFFRETYPGATVPPELKEEKE